MGNKATVTVLPLERTSVPGVYRRGARFVVVYRSDGRQRKETATTLSEARAIKIVREGLLSQRARSHARSHDARAQ